MGMNKENEMAGTPRVHRYRGEQILRCHWADGEHQGKWYVQSRHISGMTWADEASPHHRTIADAKEYIDILKENWNE